MSSTKTIGATAFGTRAQSPNQKKEKLMLKEQNDNRVLSRKGARSVSEQELNTVSGGFNTFVCTVSLEPPYVKDGDAC